MKWLCLRHEHCHSKSAERTGNLEVVRSPPSRWLASRGPRGSLHKRRSSRSHFTRKGTLLESVPPGVTTWTLPVVAPAGTVVVIKELETTLKAAAVP